MLNSNYEDSIEAAILEHLDAFDLVDLCRQVGGAYPVTVLQCLESLWRANRLTDVQFSVLAGYTPQLELIDDLELPVPHPLDSNWRLGHATRDRITLDLVDEAACGRILLIGVPTVYHKLATSERDIILVDSDRALKTLFNADARVIVSSVDQSGPIEPAASVIFADPPWYTPVTLHTIWLAAASARIGAKVRISIPGLLTRPGIRVERDELRSFASDCGLVLIALKEDALGYLSPPFEYASLDASGLKGFPQKWRRGTLAVYEKVEEKLPRRPLPLPDEQWAEVVLSNVRLRFRSRPTVNFDPTPIPLAATSVRRTVSTRDPVIKIIDVWTSGNQVFRCESPSQLESIARSVMHGCDPYAMVQADLGRNLLPYERVLVDRARDELARIVSRDITNRASIRYSAD